MSSFPQIKPRKKRKSVVGCFGSLFNRYVPPLATLGPRLPESAEEISVELRKQESLLSQIHAEMHAGFVTQRREEQLWEGQRIVTQLKRQLRTLQKSADPSSSSQTQSSLDERQMTQEEDCEKPPSSIEVTSQVQSVPVDDRIQISRPPDKNVTIVNEPKVVCFPQEAAPIDKTDAKVTFPLTETFEDNFENYEEIPKPAALPTSKNEMTESVYSNNSEITSAKLEKPKLSDEELQLMRLQLEHAEYLQLKSILQAKINSERFEIVKLRSHMAIKNKQENNLGQQFPRDTIINYTDAENEERQRLMKANALLEQRRIALAHQIFQERIACIELRIQLAMNEIL